MRIGNKNFDLERETLIMGILNVTPDSFSDGGKYGSIDSALFHTELMIEQGVDILDIGGESTRPGFEPVSAQEEINRILPVIEGIKERFDVPISVDTYKSQTARVALAAGADMINDIWGLKADPMMGDVIAESGAACCLMHNKEMPVYQNLMEDLKAELKEIAEKALDAGIGKKRIILDPGVGFGKTYEHNLQVISHLEEFKELGYPILLGASRKSVIGKTLDLPTEERLEGTLAITAAAVLKGCSILRVHDVKENRRVVTMIKELMKW